MNDWRALISDPHASGEILLGLASNAATDPAALEALAGDEAHLRRTPAIASAIYRNPAAPLSVANRAVATCAQAGMVLDDIPGFDELARAIAADPAALDSSVADSTFTAVMLGTAETSSDVDVDVHVDDDVADHGIADERAQGDGASAADTTAASGDAPSAPGHPKRTGRRSATIDFSRLKLYEKIRLATLGNAYCRQNLLRDSNRMVAMAAIRSPQITDGEVAKAAANRSLSEEVIRYISNRKELVKQYAVKLALVGNAKCPLATALRLLPTLHAEDIKQLARSKNIPGALAVAAKRLAATRGPQ